MNTKGFIWKTSLSLLMDADNIHRKGIIIINAIKIKITYTITLPKTAFLCADLIRILHSVHSNISSINLYLA